MNINDKQIAALSATDKKQTFALGNSLFLVVAADRYGGSKGFIGRVRFPPGRSGKQIEMRIGTYGKGSGKWSLKDARTEWDRIRLWAKQTGRDPRDLYKEERAPKIDYSRLKTLRQAVDSYLERSDHAPTTKKDYQNKLRNQVLPALGEDTYLKDLEWENDGRQKVLAMKRDIERRGSLSQSDRVLMISRMLFEYAIDEGWMKPPNPALGSKSAKSAHVPRNNPSLSWDQLPKFFDDLEGQREKKSPIVVGAVHLTMMTFLRVGALAAGRWDEVDQKENLWTIPAEKMKARKNHEIPITPEIQLLLDKMYEYNGNTDWFFYSPRGKANPYINPASINKMLIDVGYKDVTTAHGMRSLALTAGQEVLGFDAEVIRRQLAHAVGDKIQQAYDKTKFIDERREFMNAWTKALVDQGMRI